MNVFLKNNIQAMIKNFLKLFNWEIFLIFILGFLSISWFRGNNLISGGDFGMPLDWIKYLKLMRFVWDETIALGVSAYRQVALLISYALIGGLLQFLGFSLSFIEKFLFYFWFAGSGLSMYYLCYVLGMCRIGRLTASIFYMLNPFSLIIIWRVSHGLIQMPYAFAPMVFGLYIYGLKKKKNLPYVILACFIWLFLTGSAYANPRMIIIHWLPILFYFFWALVFQKQERKFILKYTLSFFIFWFLLNAYLILPFINSSTESMAAAHSPFLMPDIEEIKLTSVEFIKAIRMSGYWSFKSGYKGEPYYPYWEFYESFPISLIGWLIPFFVIFGFLNQKIKKRPFNYFFLSMLIFGLLGINGANPPFGRFFMWLCGLFPPLALLARFNFLLFGMPTYLIFSILLGYGFITVYDYGFKKIGSLIFIPLITSIILLSVVLVFPFWNGEVIMAEGKILSGERFKVPDYWYEIRDWLSLQKDFFRILPLPMSKTYNVNFDWEEGYSGGDPIRWLTSQPVLNNNISETSKISALIGESIEKEVKFKDIAKLLGFLNVKYLLMRNDIRWELAKGHGWYFDHDPENIEKFIKNQAGLTLEKEIGQVEFYRLKDEYLLPHIYVPQIITTINNNIESVLDLSQFLTPEKKEMFLFSNDIESDFVWRNPLVPKPNERNDLSRADYEIFINKKARFELFLRDNGFVKFYLPDLAFKVKIDEKEIQEKWPVFVEDNLISLGEIELCEGEHVISIFAPSAVNLIDNPSFEEFSDDYEYSTDAFEGKYSLSLSDDSKDKIISFPVKDYEVGETYHFSFSAKYIQGRPSALLVWLNYSDSLIPDFEPKNILFNTANLKTIFSKYEIPLNHSWQKYELFVPIQPFGRSIGLSFTFASESQQEISYKKTESLFDDIRVQRVFTNSLILKNLDKQSEKQIVPQLSFEKISPVKYKVIVKNAQEPFWLVFSESYNSGWKTSIGGQHKMVNGFANGWYLEKTGDYEFTIFFAPQKIFNLSVGISFFSAVFSLSYLFIKRFKENHISLKN